MRTYNSNLLVAYYFFFIYVTMLVVTHIILPLCEECDPQVS